VHEIKLDGFRMAARIDKRGVRLLTRTGLDWTDKYPSINAALANLNVKTAYLDGELCGVGDAGLPSFAHTQAATDGERDVRLLYYAFDLLHLDGQDVSRLQLVVHSINATGGSGADAQPGSFGSLPRTSGQTGSTKTG
jgi:ATP-dependent DNA ligase